ncbi:MAG: tRNA (adenosine(37)-N6)-threonylcarbamoyltransferase complex ATPase subunit type 1 TsaE [Thiotrichales bacterium]
MLIALPDEAATVAFARRLAPLIGAVDLITLAGDLGAGKTTLVRALLQALGHAGRVKSPTFTLLEPYEIAGRAIYHFDLYRLASPDELEYLGFADYRAPGALCLIEWPERAAGWLEPADLQLTLRYADEGGRWLEASAASVAGRAVLAQLGPD